MNKLIEKINSNNFNEDDLQIIFTNYSPLEYLPQINVNLEKYYNLFLNIDCHYYTVCIIEKVLEYINKVFNKETSDYLCDIFNYFLDKKMYKYLINFYYNYYYSLTNVDSLLKIEETLIFALEHDMIYEVSYILQRISVQHLFYFIQKNDYFYEEYFFSYIYYDYLNNKLSINDILDLLDYNNKHKQKTIHNPAKILKVFVSKINDVIEIKKEYVEIIKNLFSSIQINEFANSFANSFKFKQDYLHFLYLIQPISDEKMELKYIKKLRNKRFYNEIILQWFLTNYTFKYKKNKSYLESLLMLKKLK